MAPYLPRDGHTGSPYSEGGALYALGRITANQTWIFMRRFVHELRA
jgi:hypothetical protein